MTVSEERALSLVVALHRLQRSLRHAAGGGRASPTALIVLTQLHQHGPLRIGTIAERVPCSQPTATMVVAGLEAEGLVDRRPDPDDGRATQAVLTEQGREELRTFGNSQAKVLAERLDTLPAAQRDSVLALDEALRKLAEPS
ncbi:MarR family winged helix-turn-helix transcriptional regulator [Sciscionella sediminilitoris]|uniref:MarR family winged helix-turn-helix transcriptional regulator n=1 Tax=Sciscionella sediminilitoris TaxID=1445613 RepID=UPI0004DF4D3A|nr:MarR family transcriptional regulator [Sciscionella sp. SE31]